MNPSGSLDGHLKASEMNPSGSLDGHLKAREMNPLAAWMDI